MNMQMIIYFYYYNHQVSQGQAQKYVCKPPKLLCKFILIIICLVVEYKKRMHNKRISFTSNRYTSNSSQNSHFSYSNGFSDRYKRLYNAILNFDKYQSIKKHEEHEENIKKFINYPNQKALFIFGPTGCGKTMMIINILKKFKIPFQQCSQIQKLNENYDSIEEDEIEAKNLIKISLREVILKQIHSSAVTRVCLFKDFPAIYQQNYKDQNYRNLQFRKKFFKLLPDSQCKFIFVLNSDMYSSYSITSTYGILNTTTIVQLKPYKQIDLKKILKHFLQNHSQFNDLVSKDEIQTIVKTSVGDMRKVFLDFYLTSIEKSIKKKDISTKKVTLFHGLGKYLYAKRYDQVKCKDRVFSREQLLKEDPPFYFNPVELLQKMGVSLRIFEDLLIENYLKKFGSVQDVKNMTELFIHLNTRFPFYTTNKYLKEGEDKAQWLYCLLLTWGIILNNKDSSLVKKSFLSFCRPVHSYISKQIEKKKELIRRLYKGKKIQSLANINYIFRQTKKARKIVICLILHNQYYKNNDIGQGTKMISQEQESNVNEQQFHSMISMQQIHKVMKNHFVSHESERIMQIELDLDEDEPFSSDID